MGESFTQDIIRIKVETAHFIKGIHNLLNAHFDLRNYGAFESTLAYFENFYLSPECQQHDNFRIHSFVYLTGARLNWHLMTGTFKEGLQRVPIIEENVRKNALHLDQHRLLVFNYKIASLHFGYGSFNGCIDYLQKIIHEPTALRYDLQCYARLMHLMAHYELGNDIIMDSLIKSTYRFMDKMNNIAEVEEAIFSFLRKSVGRLPIDSKVELEKLLQQLKVFQQNKLHTRSFAYFDFVSYIESKLLRKSMGAVLQEKNHNSRRK